MSHTVLWIPYNTLLTKSEADSHQTKCKKVTDLSVGDKLSIHVDRHEGNDDDFSGTRVLSIESLSKPPNSPHIINVEFDRFPHNFMSIELNYLGGKDYIMLC